VVWTVLVLVFLFVPILLVVRHSFNDGPSFSIWSGRYSTVWWGGEPGRTPSGQPMVGLFRFPELAPVLVSFVVLIAIGIALPRVVARITGTRNRHLSRWSFPAAIAIAVVLNGFRTDWYRSIFEQAGVGDGLRGSFLAAFGATVVAVVLGGLCGIALARHPGRWSKVMMALLFLILVTPEIMDAIALAGWMQRVGGPFTNDLLGVPFGMVRLWVGQSLYASAVVTLIVRARLAGVDESLEEAAGDLGAPPGRAFRQITLPLISSALIAGGLLSFTLCLDNTIISTLISGASSTFPVALVSATKSEIKPFWAVGAVVLFLLTMALLAFLANVLRKSGESSSQIAATLTGS
jgi:ABC-type spermidine/putrescine transport system permease subunit II